MNDERMRRTAAEIKKNMPEEPAAAVILGSGLGPVAERAELIWQKPYKELPGFPESTAPGHAGRFIYSKIQGRPVIMFQGRFHYYEGHDSAAVSFPARLAAALGLKILILSNAAGGIPPAAEAGDLMLIEDQLSFFAPSPLCGPNDERIGPRFPDMTEVYSKRLINLAEEAGKEAGIPLKKGVYAFMRGPQYETPAEIRALKSLGADAVGMSTVPEAIAACHAGMEVFGLSCITNTAAGMGEDKLSHEEVLKQGAALSAAASDLIEKLIEKL